MAPHTKAHWTAVACLCLCHYEPRECDDKTCARILADEAAHTVAPVTAQAAEPTIAYETPLGATTRFGH